MRCVIRTLLREPIRAAEQALGVLVITCNSVARVVNVSHDVRGVVGFFVVNPTGRNAMNAWCSVRLGFTAWVECAARFFVVCAQSSGPIRGNRACYYKVISLIGARIESVRGRLDAAQRITQCNLRAGRTLQGFELVRDANLLKHKRDQFDGLRLITL
jgi:hypothetical protein